MKNILIGVLMTTCVFLMIGANSHKVAKVGRYQIAPFGKDLIMIDTETAEPHILLDEKYDKSFQWLRIATESIFIDQKDWKNKMLDDSMKEWAELMKKYED